MQSNKTLIIQFSVAGGPCYLSQQETLTMWGRALLRANINAAFSQGFNPHMKLSLPLPRTVGVEGDEELLRVKVCDIEDSPDGIRSRLNHNLPDGIRVESVEILDSNPGIQPQSILYVFIPAQSLRQPAFAARLESCRQIIEQKQPVVYTRRESEDKKKRTVDIGVYLQSLNWDDREIQLRCRFTPTGAARVDELTDWLGLQRTDLIRPVRRTQIKWSTNESRNEQE